MNGLRIAWALAVLALRRSGRVGVGPPQSPAEHGSDPGRAVRRGLAGDGLGEKLGGSACWLRGADGAVRIEVTREGAAGRADVSPAWGRLLTRGGEGLGRPARPRTRRWADAGAPRWSVSPPTAGCAWRRFWR